MRQMADNNVGGEARVDENRRIPTLDETKCDGSGQNVFPFLDSRNLYLALFTEESSSTRCDGGG